MNNGQTSVYLYYDRRDILLYVGITNRGVVRNVEHNGTKDWWPYVTRQEVRHYASRDEAATVEKSMIKRHRPPFNRQHNPDYLVKSAAYVSYSPAPQTDDSNWMVCDICGTQIESGFTISVDPIDLVRATAERKAFERACDADAHVQILDILDEALALVRGSGDQASATRGIAELAAVSSEVAGEFLSAPIYSLTNKWRAARCQDRERLDGVGTPTLARWRVHHQGCADSEYSFDFPKPLTAEFVVTVTHNLHRFWSEWLSSTDWMQFFPRLFPRAE